MDPKEDPLLLWLLLLYEGVWLKSEFEAWSCCPPINWTVAATISVVYFFTPFWSSQDLVWSFPSIKAWRPFFRYWLHNSANLPQTTIRCHSVFSCFWPLFLSVQLSFVAREKLQTGWPEAVYFISGSCPSRPSKITLFILIDLPPSRSFLKKLKKTTLKSGRQCFKVERKRYFVSC